MKKGRKPLPHEQGAQKAVQHPTQRHKPGFVQAKSAVTARGKQPPAMPHVYRPQPAPNVLQGKMGAPRQAVNPLKRPPAAPPVYRPQPVPQVLQPKAAGGQQPRADKPSGRPVAPPVYRPEPKSFPSKPAPPPSPALQMKPNVPPPAARLRGAHKEVSSPASRLPQRAAATQPRVPSVAPTPARPGLAPTLPHVSANVAQAKTIGLASKSLPPSQRFAAPTHGVSGPPANRGRIIQAKMVNLPDNYVALDEDPESIINDGEVKYKIAHASVAGGRYLLEDNWGDLWLYDNATGARSYQDSAGHSADVNDYLLVDCHLVHPTLRPDLTSDVLPFKGVQRIRWTGEANGSIMSIDYGFGNWTVSVYWPSKWLLRGEQCAPAPNRLGLAPAGEFGVSNWSGGSTSVRQNARVAPFAYKTVGGTTYTPEAAFVNNETISKEHWLGAKERLKEGKDFMMAIAPIVLANRK